MGMTRRQLLRRSALAAAGITLGPGLFSSRLVRRAMAETIGDRYLVVLFWDGGNDGLNTVVPRSAPAGNLLRTAYEANRLTGSGGIGIDRGDLLAVADDPHTGEQLGLHPGLAGIPGVAAGAGGLSALYGAGRVALIQGCGYPDYSLSHDESRGVWQRGTRYPTGASAGAGWVGRHLQAEYGSLDVPAVCIQNSVAPELRQLGTGVLAVRRLSRFGFPYDDFADGEDAEEVAERALRRAAFESLYGEAAAAGAPAQLVGTTGLSMLGSSDAYRAAHALYQSDRSAIYGEGYEEINRSVGYDLREVAKMIYAQESGAPETADVAARFFQLRTGGYDTHADQGAAESDGNHFRLHAAVASSLKHFFDDLDAMGSGVADKVAVLVYSEFSRRIRQNENGSDHGSQGPMIVVGGKVNGGVYGRHPNIDDLDNQGCTVYSQGSGPGFWSTDFRDVYGTVLRHWVQMSAGGVATLLPPDSGPPAESWTVANFDLTSPQNGNPLFLP